MRYPHTVTVKRLQPVDGKQIFTQVGFSEGFLQPIDNESSQLFGITHSKGSVLYAPIESIIKEKDQLNIYGKTYGVRGLAPRPYGSKRMQHNKFVLEQV